jgi:hypothetical protein
MNVLLIFNDIFKWDGPFGYPNHTLTQLCVIISFYFNILYIGFHILGLCIVTHYQMMIKTYGKMNDIACNLNWIEIELKKNWMQIGVVHDYGVKKQFWKYTNPKITFPLLGIN